MSKRSNNLPLWNFFDKPIDGSKTALCNYCHRKFSFKTTITNLKQHLKQKHFSVYNTFINFGKTLELTSVPPISKVTLSEIESDDSSDIADEDEPPIKVEKVKHLHLPKKRKLNAFNEMDLTLLKMIVYDFQPFSIVNDVGFRAFTHALNPHYEIPDRKTLSMDLLPIVYEKRLEEVKSFIQMNAKSVCITIEYWTSHTMESYLGITAHFMTEDPIELESVLIQCVEWEGHHTDMNIHKELQELLKDWGIYDKVNFFVTDNASNMENLGQYFELDGWIHFGCFADKLNLVVQDALAEIRDTVEKVQRVVNHFTKSSVSKDKLLNFQRNQWNITQPKTVIKSVPTLWTSVYLMLERFVELQESLQATIPDSGTDLPIILMKEWKCIEQICVILKPFYEATVEMSAENYLVASKAIILTSSLVRICDNYTTQQELYPSVKKLAKQLKQGMTKHLGDLEKNDTICLSTILDPRFKLKAIKDKERIKNLKELLKMEITHKLNKKILLSKNPEQVPPELSTSAANSVPSQIYGCTTLTYSLWCDFDSENNKEFESMSSDVQASEELEKYLADNLIKRTECPFKYWQEHKLIYPELYDLFMKYYNVVVTSVPCEQIFSKSGYLISDRRTRLSTTKIAEIMFLNVNKM